MDMRASPYIVFVLSIIFFLMAKIIDNQNFEIKSIWKQKFYKLKRIWEKIIDFLIPPKSNKAKILNLKLKNMGKNQNTYKFFFYKLAFVTLVGLLSYTIYMTNLNYNINNGGKELRKWLYIIVSISAYWIPDIFMEFYIKNKYIKYEKDLTILKITTFLLASMGLQVKEILYYLEELTPAYKNIFRKCLNNYNSVQIGSQRAVMEMTEDVNVLHFRKLCMTLRDMLTGDKKRAVKNLEIDMELEQKENEMRIEAKIDTNAMISVILIMPVMFMLLLIMLFPLLNYLKNFEMILG